MRKAIIVKGKYPTKKERRKPERLILKRLEKQPMSIYQLYNTFHQCSSPLIMTSLFRLIARGKVLVREEKEWQAKRKALTFHLAK